MYLQSTVFLIDTRTVIVTAKANHTSSPGFVGVFRVRMRCALFSCLCVCMCYSSYVVCVNEEREADEVLCVCVCVCVCVYVCMCV